MKLLLDKLDAATSSSSGSASAFPSITMEGADGEMYHKDIQAVNLRVVDCLKDEGVWAIIDEGCNSGCHGQRWRENADIKFEKLGFKSVFHKESNMAFKGIGNNRSSGQWKSQTRRDSGFSFTRNHHLT